MNNTTHNIPTTTYEVEQDKNNVDLYHVVRIEEYDVCVTDKKCRTFYKYGLANEQAESLVTALMDSLVEDMGARK